MQTRRGSTLITLIIALSLAVGPLLGFAQPTGVCESMQSVQQHAADMDHSQHDMAHGASGVDTSAMPSDCCDGDCQCNASLSSSTVMMVAESFHLGVNSTGSVSALALTRPNQPLSSSYKPPILA